MVELENICRSMWEKLIDEWTFNEVDRHLLKRRLLDGVTFERLAVEVNLSYDQAWRRFKKAKNNLLKHL